jgi:hypothetical protein
MSVFRTIKPWLNQSGAVEIEKWTHVFLTHAGTPTARKVPDDFEAMRQYWMPTRFARAG